MENDGFRPPVRRHAIQKNSKNIQKLTVLAVRFPLSLNLVRHDSLRQLTLAQLTHLSRAGRRQKLELYACRSHLAASEHCVMCHCVN